MLGVIYFCIVGQDCSEYLKHVISDLKDEAEAITHKKEKQSATGETKKRDSLPFCSLSS